MLITIFICNINSIRLRSSFTATNIFIHLLLQEGMESGVENPGSPRIITCIAAEYKASRGHERKKIKQIVIARYYYPATGGWKDKTFGEVVYCYEISCPVNGPGEKILLRLVRTDRLLKFRVSEGARARSGRLDISSNF